MITHAGRPRQARISHTPLRRRYIASSGYELNYDFPQPTPLIGMLNLHYSRVADLVEPDHIEIHPSVRISGYRDLFGN